MISGQLLNEFSINLPVEVNRTSTMLERMRGLLFRKKLATNEAIWIEPCNSIHTFFMAFPIDAVFLDQTGTVVQISENLPAWRMAGSFKAVAVIEFIAGETRKLGIKQGQQFQWRNNNA